MQDIGSPINRLYMAGMAGLRAWEATALAKLVSAISRRGAGAGG
jgi:hypothetical protein